METLTRAQKIERLEKELADLREQEQIEQEELKRKAEEDKGKELTAIKNAITAFNEKHGDDLRLTRYDVRMLNDKLFGRYIERSYIEV